MKHHITGAYTSLIKWLIVPLLCALFLFLALTGEQASDRVFAGIAALIFLGIGIWEKIVHIDISANEIYISGYLHQRVAKLTDIVDVKEVITIRLVSIIKIKFKKEKSVVFSMLTGRHGLIRGQAAQPHVADELLKAASLAADIQSRKKTVSI